MRRRTRKPPLKKRDKWRLRLIATGGAVLLAAAIFFMQSMPAAESLVDPDDVLSATSTQTLALYNLRAAPVMLYNGAIGAGLKVSVSTGRLTPATRKNLAALGVAAPNVKGGPIEWQGKPPPDGRVEFKIVNQRQSPDGGMMLQATGSGRIAEMNIRAAQTVLMVQIDLTTQQSPQVPLSELTFAGTVMNSPRLGFSPLQFEIPPGESMNLRFDNEEALADSTFRLGELLDTGGTATALQVGRAEVGRLASNRSYPRLRSVIRGVCASRPGKLLFTHLYPRPNECAVGDNLYANDIAIEPRKLALTLEGSGFVLKNNTARPSSFWSAFMGNPVIAAFVAALVFAVAGPVWRLWTGRNM